MNVLTFGANGQVGRSLMQANTPPNVKLTGLSSEAADITKVYAIDDAIRNHEPDVIINAAAYTDVDGAEAARKRAFHVNANGPAVLAEACCRFHIPLLHLSTDSVFDGSVRRPYREHDPIAPINTYGESKAEGERLIRDTMERHMILRVSWIFSSHGTNFVKNILGLSHGTKPLSVIADQTGCPTSADDIADMLLKLAARSTEDLPWGTYHFCGREPITWYEFAREIIAIKQDGSAPKINIVPIATSDYGHAAARAPYAVLDCRHAINNLNLNVPTWRAALKKVVAGWQYENN